MATGPNAKNTDNNPKAEKTEGTTPDLPETADAGFTFFRSHKTVQAAEITNIAGYTLMLGENQLSYPVTEEWVKHHNPQIGGYLVKYSDGYLSYSPKEPFEEGYSATEEKEEK